MYNAVPGASQFGNQIVHNVHKAAVPELVNNKQALEVRMTEDESQLSLFAIHINRYRHDSHPGGGVKYRRPIVDIVCPYSDVVSFGESQGQQSPGDSAGAPVYAVKGMAHTLIGEYQKFPAAALKGLFFQEFPQSLLQYLYHGNFPPVGIFTH
jgi:hypothetical protein